MPEHSRRTIFLVLICNDHRASLLLQKYPQILKYQTNTSPDIRCGFAEFAVGLEKQKSLDILNVMKKTEKDEYVNQCIEKSIQWRSEMD